MDMIVLDECVLIESDINAGGGATLNLYFDHAQGNIVEDKTTCDSRRQVSEMSISDAIDNLTDEQVR